MVGAERLCVIRWVGWPEGEDLAVAHRAFEPCVRVVAEMAPRVEVGAPGQLCFATRGPSRYFGGDGGMVAELLARLAPPSGAPWPRPGVGVAEGRLAATVAALRSARTGEPVLVPPGATPGFLAALPVRVLAELGGLPLDLVGRLDRLGLRRLGDVVVLPVTDLVARFGPDGARAHRLASGADGEPVLPGVPAPAEEAVARLDDPLPQLDAVVFVARRLAEELVARLASGGRVCTVLRVEVETDHGERSERCWAHPDGLSAPAVVERVRWQITSWQNEDGDVTAGVVLVRLCAEEVRADRGRQVALWGGQRQADEAAVRAIARVSGLLGPDGVQVPEWRGGRDPWQQYQLVPAVAVDPDERPARVRPEPRPWPGSLPPPSPARVLARPVQVEVVDRAGRLVQVSGRGELSAPPSELRAQGRSRPVASWAGPWPVEERWWDPRRHRRRARLQLVTDDGEAVLVAIEQGCWWLRAVYA